MLWYTVHSVVYTCDLILARIWLLGLCPFINRVLHKTPYPPAYDQIPLPHKYKMPNFTKFSRQGEVSTMEHVNRFLLQLGEAGNHDALRVRLFSLSLSGSAFAWFTTLPANSILYWADLERQFHQFFFSGITELKLIDLTGLRQKKQWIGCCFYPKVQRCQEPMLQFGSVWSAVGRCSI